MLLRSSSTPILSSLISSSSSHFLSGDSPANHHYHVHSPATFHHQSPASLHHHVQVSCHMSPVFSDTSFPSHSSLIRRTRSDGNLSSLLTDHSDSRSSSRKSIPSLETISSSVANSVLDEETEEEAEESEETINQINSFLDEGGNLAMAPPPLFLARGLGIDRVGSGLLTSGGDFCGGDGNGKGGRGGSSAVTTEDGRDRSDLETYYNRMVQENPRDPLFLRNYAMFLHQVKFDFQRAEEYYSRAILLDPNDGETLSKYASLVWELHRDEERAASYFEQAVKASPQNSFVHAAYAGFLWDADDYDSSEDQGSNYLNDFTGFTNQLGEMTSITT
ncbi:hypothetical protein LUZ60_014977 [Juncus effusus]|nr:hypothetical protein LUZ60_014977 [Juncus effusus]